MIRANSKKMKTAAFAVLAVVMGLTACAPIEAGFDTGSLPGVGAIESDTLTVGEDVSAAELSAAPEVYNLKGIAVWNGGRTVPGIWVAHPTATKPMDVRIVHTATGKSVVGRLLHAKNRPGNNQVTLSSDAAAALGLEPRRRARLSIVALLPGDLATRRSRQGAERSARAALTGFAATLDNDRLAQLVGALMRGMGYRTEFEDGLIANDGGAGIRAKLAGKGAPDIRVAVRSGGNKRISGGELAAFGKALRTDGSVGLVVSVPGFGKDVRRSGLMGGAFVEMLDLDGLLDLWVDRYQDVAAVDRELMPLKPVYFLAGN